jgi:phosphatidylserine/phosphatidylglycerophosphate/cardiolipin synthase-like enzyme
MKGPLPLSLVFFTFVSTAFCRDTPSTTTAARNLVEQVAAVEIYFSPKGGGEHAMLDELKRAQSSVLVLAYSFTSTPVAKALGEAKDRGVDVQVILDKSHRKARYSVINYLQSHGIPVFIDVPHAIAHNKVMIIDGRHVITGSYNFTSAAEKRNTENLLFIKNEPRVARIYAEEWQRLRSKSEPAPATGAPFVGTAR